MAELVSIKVNEIDIRSAYNVQALSLDILSMPELKYDSYEFANREGAEQGIGNYQSRIMRIRGEILPEVGAVRSSFITKTDNFKKLVSGGVAGLRNFRLYFQDRTDATGHYFIAKTKNLTIEEIGPYRTAITATFLWEIEILEPFGNYDTLTLTNHADAPFGTSASFYFDYNGTAPSRPIIIAKNTIAQDITSLRIINLAVRNRFKTITPSVASLAWTDGVFGDYNGGIYYNNQGQFRIDAISNFSESRFTVCAWVKIPSGQTNAGYIFSTTGNTIRGYYSTTFPEAFYIDINGLAVRLENSVTGFQPNEWWFIAFSYNGNTARIKMQKKNTSTAYTSAASASVTYRGANAYFYLGSTATYTNQGYKYLDDVRIYNRVITGMDSTPSGGNEFNDLATAKNSLPIVDGISAHFNFDKDVLGYGWENNDMTITQTISNNEALHIDCDKMQVYELTATPSANPTNAINTVTGSFPILVPGNNSFKIVHNGAASSLDFAIEDKRRFL